MQSSHQSNIEEINKLHGYNIIIVCTSTLHQAAYWQARLMSTRGCISSTDCQVIAVHEDWEGGAGNGLGTLYAYRKAVEIAKESYGLDISDLLYREEISVALYHTAGKGTRLAPLPGSENNNKSGVKLPAMVQCGSEMMPMTILEAVIKQTGVYGKCRKGRLSVFWGDQVFIPSASISYVPCHHVDILAALAPMPTEAEWKENGLEKYGLIAVNTSEQAAQVDKVTYGTAKRLLSSLGQLKAVGTSLGSFSIDADMLFSLLEEFKPEILLRQGAFDSDPHFWMPLTLNASAYLEVMSQKNVCEKISKAHFQRMQKFLARFYQTRRSKHFGLFGCVDVGRDVYWWDYGQLKLYLKNNCLVTQHGVEADCLRSFLGIKECINQSQIGMTTNVEHSTVLNSQIFKGNIRNSVLSTVTAREVYAEGSILINVTAHSIRARRCVVYNVTSAELDGLNLSEGTVLVGVLLPNGEKIVMQSNLDVCGGKAWKDKLELNKHSFEAIYNMNAHANVSELEKLVSNEHIKLRCKVFA